MVLFQDETPSMKTCKDSDDSPQKHLVIVYEVLSYFVSITLVIYSEMVLFQDETPSVILPKFIYANSTELPPSDQPIYDTKSKSR